MSLSEIPHEHIVKEDGLSGERYPVDKRVPTNFQIPDRCVLTSVIAF
jgi:hypothetical protein